MRLIDYSYEIPYSYVGNFVFERKNDIVSFEDYQVLQSYTNACSDILKEDPNSRKACATLNNWENTSCLINIHFLINDNNLYVIANYRSQHELLGRPYDEELVKYLTTLFIKHNNFKFNSIKLKCHISDYHSK